MYIAHPHLSPPIRRLQRVSRHYDSGKPSLFHYGASGELKFRDEAAFGGFFACVTSAENAAKIASDEEKFLDRAKMTAVVVGDCTTMSGDSAPL
jgi:hypothetical protein